jgi:hypothetical protein
MNLKIALLGIITSLATVTTALPAKADTVPAHCDIYAKGEDYPSKSTPCTFSQRQGYIGIERADGIRYELSPAGDKPATYTDQNGKSVTREDGLGNAGLIFRMSDVSVYVYWDSESFDDKPASTGSGTRVGTLIAHERESQINVRSEATIKSRAIAYGLAGDQVEIKKCVQDKDTANSDLNWCKVRFLESGAMGWIRSDFIVFPSDGE